MDAVDKLIRFDLGRRLQDDKNSLENVHKTFWSNQQADGWYAATNHKLELVYIPNYSRFVDEVADKIRSRGIKNLVEFGTGNGLWLEYLSTRFSGLVSCIGIDLSESQIRANTKMLPGIEFIRDDIDKWIQSNLMGDTIYHTNSGVLEYLSEDSVERMFSTIKSRARNSFMFLIEPVSLDCDPKKLMRSWVGGEELSYSHNYKNILERLNFRIEICEDLVVDNHKTVVILAGT
ncbi:MAG: methyltransferase domain-containing protein [Cellvibrionaceae bacterium]